MAGRTAAAPLLRRLSTALRGARWDAGAVTGRHLPISRLTLASGEAQAKDGSAAEAFSMLGMAFTHRLEFVPEVPPVAIPCFRMLGIDGGLVADHEANEVGQELAMRIYEAMVQLQVMDTIFFEAQRQGRFSFYLTTAGEEAVNISSAAALSAEDIVFAQYREPGVLLWRGFSLAEFADQCVGNAAGHGKGRQMPVHYGTARLRFHTISSPLATQIPHAVGAAYSLKQSGEDACAIAYFGEGATSEGDFHGAINFAAVLGAPVLFLCRNNGWAISTPAREQFRGDGIAGRGQGYGVRAIRVDGNDALAMYKAVKEARRVAVTEYRPVLIEALTYRLGHHSTSDDSSRYRAAAELDQWRQQGDPVKRLQKHLLHNGWWDETAETVLRTNARQKVLTALEEAEQKLKPNLSEMFLDVLDKVPENLVEQERDIRDSVRRHPNAYPPEVPL